ncbi:hypothetical protein CASFOL_005988 [Castilleja foliolosa]|uniref:UV-stimulated scaffold protein A C-terminal domain-containing protein n=1 Tax=Castilleja foliolosa TaxID=1961234 RepID=A0ABD3E8Z9_9LAMI
MEEEREKAAAVVNLIEKAVESTAAEVDPRLLKAIKFTVRYSDSELRFAAKTLMSLMKRDHSQVRYLALLIIDELFMRSKLFRTLLVENLDQLLSLSVGFRRNHPLPAPASVASILRSKAIVFLEKWNDSFGINYRQLRLGYDYLKNTLRFQFPNLQANAARVQQERREREIRTEEILLKKFESLKENFSSLKEEILSKIDEINECLEILRSEDDEGNIPLAPTNDDEEMEEFRSSELRQIRLDSIREGEKVHENSENEVVFDALRELHKVLVTKHLAAIQECISVLIRVDASDNRFRDTALKDLIDLRNLIQSTNRKCEDSGCDLSKITKAEEDDYIWEDGAIKTFEKAKFSPSCSEIASTSDGTRVAENVVKSVKGKSKKNQNSELLKEAPVLNWGSFLDNWGSKRDALANQRGLDLDGHWGRVDQDAVIPAEKIAELNVHASIYKEALVDIKPCRAPLKKGGLCERKDLRVCPFHGPVVPRDDEGKPIIDEKPVTEETTKKDMDSLLKQAVKNVRERDKEEAKKREIDKQALKRAKLAKVREHNEAVLRDAAFASTSRSEHVGEEDNVGMGNSLRSSSRSNKQKLASMLKKKESTKDRLGERLLNSRARDATIKQITVAEDANYRESFPNQW